MEKQIADLVEFVEDVKHHTTDQRYIDIMANLQSLYKFIKEDENEDDETTPIYGNLLAVAAKMRRVVIRFAEDNDIDPLEFKSSHFNLTNCTSYMRSIRFCGCTGNNICASTTDDTRFKTCINLQKYVIKHPLLLYLVYPNEDKDTIKRQTIEFDLLNFELNDNFDEDDEEDKGGFEFVEEQKKLMDILNGLLFNEHQYETRHRLCLYMTVLINLFRNAFCCRKSYNLQQTTIEKIQYLKTAYNQQIIMENLIDFGFQSDIIDTMITNWSAFIEKHKPIIADDTLTTSST